MFQVRALPMLVDLSGARTQALKRWFDTAGAAPPFSRAGRQMASPEIDWLPPLKSASADEPGSAHVSLGRAGDLAAALLAYEGDRSGVLGKKSLSAAKKIPKA